MYWGYWSVILEPRWAGDNWVVLSKPRNKVNSRTLISSMFCVVLRKVIVNNGTVKIEG
jgi:hypothetical protein